MPEVKQVCYAILSPSQHHVRGRGFFYPPKMLYWKYSNFPCRILRYILDYEGTRSYVHTYTSTYILAFILIGDFLM